MPTVITRGAASAQGYGYAGVKKAANYIEDVFSTYLYAGNSSTQTITNGIDLSGKGGMVWIKSRNVANDTVVTDTVRGVSSQLITNGTSGAQNYAAFQSFNSSGFTVYSADGSMNASGTNYVSWTFRKQAKFFDVVTYTGTGVARTIAHNLGSVPGCIIVKKTNAAADWMVYHTSIGNQQYINLNLTSAAQFSSAVWNNTTPTSSVFTIGTNSRVNENGSTYVAYLFAHDAGGFGAAGTDNVISCGSVSGAPNSTQTVNLGWEPQWILWKPSDDVRNWIISDNMRGLTADGTGSATLAPNLSDAESTSSRVAINATGFTMSMLGTPNPTTSIYIAIRRGPMKTPTSGTSVYNAIARTATAAVANITGLGFSPDLIIPTFRVSPYTNYGKNAADRLKGPLNVLSTTSSQAEAAYTDSITSINMDGWTVGADSSAKAANAFSGQTAINWAFKRAPGFFDVVCYTGTGANRTVSHNLGVAPELWIMKSRSAIGSWTVGSTSLANTERLFLETTGAKNTSATTWNSTYPTSSVFSLGTSLDVNTNGTTYVAYLFGTVAGVSKVGSYTGSGTTKQIDCGFTGGARFVLIKRTDSTGDWYVWDTARGIVAANDPYLLLNSTAAEVTNTDYIDTYSAGFEISSTAPAAINANGGSFIFLAIA